MGCVNSCLYMCQNFYDSFIRNNKPVQIVLGVFGGMLLMVILLAIFGAFRSHCDDCDPTTTCYYNVLSQSWPQTKCKMNLVNKSNKVCIEPLASSFTIHGLWPQLKDKNAILANCLDNNNPFDEEKLKDIKEDMKKQWPSVLIAKAGEEDKANKDFWTHEWDKHGKCSYQKEVEDYFKKTLEIQKGMNITQWLLDDQITPKNDAKYKLTKFKDAIKKKIGENQYKLRCSTLNKNGEDKNIDPIYLLDEILICVSYKNPNSILDCSEEVPGTGNGIVDCPSEFYYLADYKSFKA